MSLVLTLSRFALALGITSLVMSWFSTRPDRVPGPLGKVASAVALLAIGLVALAWSLAVAVGRP